MGILTKPINNIDMSCIRDVVLTQWKTTKFSIKNIDTENGIVELSWAHPFGKFFTIDTMYIHKRFFDMCTALGLNTIKCMYFEPLQYIETNDENKRKLHNRSISCKGITIQCADLQLSQISPKRTLAVKNLNIVSKACTGLISFDSLSKITANNTKITTDLLVISDEQFNIWYPLIKSGAKLDLPDIDFKVIGISRTMPGAKRLMRNKITHVNNLHKFLLGDGDLGFDVIAHHNKATNQYYLTKSDIKLDHAKIICDDDRGYKLYEMEHICSIYYDYL